MIAAAFPRDDVRTTRLLHLEPQRGELTDHLIGDLRTLLHAGDLLVVNDAATLPASLTGVTGAGAPVEVRLAGTGEDGCWRAVVFGAGDWRTRTEDRPAPPRLAPGDGLWFGGLQARILATDPVSPRLVTLAFSASGAALWQALYRAGRPIQYAYTARPFAIWSVQTAYAGRPWAVEPPSAGFPLTWDLLLDLRRAGVGLARVTHAAGLSSTGDEALDARLPFAERYEVSVKTVAAVERARAAGGRIVAVGTTVTRALESAAAGQSGVLAAGGGVTGLLLGRWTRRAVVDGILTGVHEVTSNHFTLLEAFAPRAFLERANRRAEAGGYHGHEFGDALLVLADSPVRQTGH